MKQITATSLLLGYILLVPFCFFGGMLMANADTMNMVGSPAHQMDDCGMPLGGCAHSMGASGMDSVIHHVGMYNSITQTPFATFSAMLAAVAVFLLLAFGLSYNWLSIFSYQNSLRPFVRRTNEPRSNTQQSTLNWLSLFETSPNFA